MSKPSKQGVLIIGGGGFIGSRLAVCLAQEGSNVHVLSPSPTEHECPYVNYHVGTQENNGLICELLNRVHYVFHLATSTVPSDTVWDPVVEGEKNILPVLKFLEIAQRYPNNRYFYMSTGGALYGKAPLATEELVPVPMSYHGAAKLALETFWGVYAQRFPESVTILRPSNVYGPGQKLRSGFGLIRTLLQRSLDGGIVEVYGSGNEVRDYLFIDDLVSGCLAAMSGPAGVFNLGAGSGYSLLELIGIVERVTKTTLNVAFHPKRASDVDKITLDASRAKDILGWCPKVEIEDGVRKTWLALKGNDGSG